MDSNEGVLVSELHVINPGADCCDFCGSVDVVTVFKTKAAAHPVQHFPNASVYVDDGEWAACTPCAVLVRNEQRELLKERSMISGVRSPEEAEPFRRFVEEIQGIFWKDLVGELTTEL